MVAKPYSQHLVRVFWTPESRVPEEQCGQIQVLQRRFGPEFQARVADQLLLHFGPAVGTFQIFEFRITGFMTCALPSLSEAPEAHLPPLKAPPALRHKSHLRIVNILPRTNKPCGIFLEQFKKPPPAM